jgi:Cu/Ag efflux pump CusA
VGKPRKIAIAAAVVACACAAAVVVLRRKYAPPGVRLLVHAGPAEKWDQTAETVEREQLVPMEEALASVQGVSHVEGLAEPQGATVAVSFVPGVSAEAARTSTQAALGGGVRVTALSERPALHVTIQGSVYTGTALRTIFEEVAGPRLAGAAGIAEVGVCGGRIANAQIEINEYQVRVYGVDLGRAIASIRNALPTARTPIDLNEVTVAEKAGASIRLRDVAALTESSSPPSCDAWRGLEGVVAGVVVLAPDADEVRTVTELLRVVRELEAGALPPGMHVVPFDFGAQGRVPYAELRVYGTEARDGGDAYRALRTVQGRGGVLVQSPTTLTFRGRARPGVDLLAPLSILARVPDGVSMVSWADEVALDLEKGLAMSTVEPIAPPARMPHPVRVHSEDLARARTCAQGMAALLGPMEAVRSVEIAQGFDHNTRWTLNPSTIARYAVDPEAARLVLDLAYGERIGAIGEGIRHRDVVVRLHASTPPDTEDLTAIRELGVVAPAGAYVRVGQLFSVEVTSAPLAIAHDAGRRVIDLRVETSVPWDRFTRDVRPVLDAKTGEACGGCDVSWAP